MLNKKFALKYIYMKFKRYGPPFIIITAFLSVFIIFQFINGIYWKLERTADLGEREQLILLLLLELYYYNLWDFIKIVLIPFFGTVFFVQNLEKSIVITISLNLSLGDIIS
ncbi:MAG: hypothetical protein ACP6IP_06910 [Candidatus Njordarchaeia archaeon]